MAYLKPQIPLESDGDYIYPVTTIDQVVMKDGTRLKDGQSFVVTNEEEESVQLLGIVDLVYPVGSIYMSVNAASPAALFGGTWEQIGQGRTLFGAGTLNDITYTAGSTIDAGLPNVAGSIGRTYSDYNAGNTSYAQFVTGPFYYNASEDYGTTANLAAGSNDAFRQTYMDLSRANSIYGKSTTVQPPAFVVYMWKRTA